MSRDIFSALFMSIPMGIATIVCILLQKRYALSIKNVVRIFCVAILFLGMLEMHVLEAMGWKGYPPNTTHPQTSG